VKRISDWLVKPGATSTKDLAAQVRAQHLAVQCVGTRSVLTMQSHHTSCCNVEGTGP
jgi:hypothetical protein